MENNKITKFNNVKEILYNSANKYAKDIAFTTKVKVPGHISFINHTYEDLLNDINAFGTSLYKLGLKGKRVAIIGHNCYEWAVSHLANLLGDMVSVPLDKGLQLEELENSLIRSEVEAVVFDSKTVEYIKKIKENKTTNIKHFICIDETDDFLYFKDLLSDGKTEIEKGNKNFINCKIDSYKMSILLFTSGTTSQSKAVMLNQHGLATNIYDMQLVEVFYNTDINIAFLPYHHIFGSTCMLMMLASGVKTVFPDGLKYIKQNLIEYKVSVFVGVPILIDKIYSAYVKEIEKQGKTKMVNFAIWLSNLLLKFHIDLRKSLFKELIRSLGGSIRFVISGGAPLDVRTAKWFNAIGIHLVQGYGLTETSPVIAAENSFVIKPGSVGLPMEHVNIKIDNPDSNGIGEILVKGPNVMMGYYNDEKRTNEVLKNGWFHTGDLGYLDKDGFLFITGRSKDLIVLKNGKKIFPDEIETVVNRIEEIDESFVFGLPEGNDKNDVKVAIKVVYNEKVVKELYPDANEDEVRDIIWDKIKEVNKTFPMYKHIKHMILTKEPLIKTTTNKVKRNEELKKILEQN